MGEGVKHVLVASLGLSPAVITETLWAMLNPPGGRPPQAVDRVHLLTTARWHPTNGYAEFDGIRADLSKRIAELYAANREKLTKLEREAPELIFEAVRRPDGGEQRYIADVSTQEENILFAGRITQIVWEYAQDPGWVIHMSLAGGRKSMSSYAHTAMMFFGRVQDELTHVLVRPGDLEFSGGAFWYPGQPEREVTCRVIPAPGEMPETRILSTAVGDAYVELVPVPFVRLNVLLPKELDISAANYAELVDYIDFVRGSTKVSFDWNTRKVSIGRKEAELGPVPFAVMATLALARAQKWKGVGPEGIGDDWHGWVRSKDLLSGQGAGSAQVNTHPAICTVLDVLERHQSEERHEKSSKAIDEVGPKDTSPISQAISRLPDYLKDKFGSAHWAAPLVPRRIKRGVWTVGLDLPPERIALVNYPEDILAMGANLAQG